MSSAGQKDYETCIVCDFPAPFTVKDKYSGELHGVCRRHHEQAFGDG